MATLSLEKSHVPGSALFHSGICLPIWEGSKSVDCGGLLTTSALHSTLGNVQRGFNLPLWEGMGKVLIAATFHLEAQHHEFICILIRQV
jgi:hypothetical protein